MTETQRLTLQAKIINAKRAGDYWAYEKAVKELHPAKSKNKHLD